MRVGIFHVGTQHSWQTARAFVETGELAWYATSVFYKPQCWPYRAEALFPPGLRNRLHREFTRRYTQYLPSDKVVLVGPYEWPRTFARRYGLLRLDRLFNRLNIRHVQQRVIGLLKEQPVDLVWGFNTMSANVFEYCRSRGIRCVLDQTIGHPKSMDQILGAEYKLHPEAFPEPYTRFSDEWASDQQREIEAASKVVAGSAFCARTLVENGCPPERIQVVPYGFDEQRFTSTRARPAPGPDTPIRFLYAGTVEARKGAHHLIRAFRDIPPRVAQLTMVGRINLDVDAIGGIPKSVTHVPQVPREEMPSYFLKADCLMMPSLFEGSALVLYEALGAGLGIVQTRSAGFGVVGGRNGLFIKPSSVPDILEAVNTIRMAPRLISEWSTASLALASQYRWADYRARCRELVRGMLLKS